MSQESRHNPECPDGEEAHIAHMSQNDECPWCDWWVEDGTLHKGDE